VQGENTLNHVKYSEFVTPLQGFRHCVTPSTQGDALGYYVLPLQGKDFSELWCYYIAVR